MKTHLPLPHSAFKIQMKAPPKKERLDICIFPSAFNDRAPTSFCSMIRAPLSIQEGDLNALGIYLVQIQDSKEAPPK